MQWSQAYKREQKVSAADAARAIREAVTVSEVLATYCPGIQIRNHRCPCPIHHGQDPNFSFTDHGYKCFVCGESGDVIDLVKAVCELATRTDAMRRINQDMNLGLPMAGDTVNAAQSAEMRLRREAAKRKQEAIVAWNERYERLMDEWAAQDRIIHSEFASVEDKAMARERLTVLDYRLLSLPEEPR